MGKICAFLGNDYDKVMGIKYIHQTPTGLKEKIREQIINLIENEDVDTFFVGEKGGYEIDAYDMVLEVQKEYPQIKVILVISAATDMNEVSMHGDTSAVRQRSFDDFILPEKCALGYKKLCIVYRNRFISENADFIIAYKALKGRAYDFCKVAKGKGAKVIELGLL